MTVSTTTFVVLRRCIGWLGILLPLVVVILAKHVPESISATYYTGARDWFVGTLFAVGSFLLAYGGYDKIDTVGSKLAGFCALGVALFPVDPEVITWVGKVHYCCASLLFLLLGWFSMFRFTKSHGIYTKQKIRRNGWYESLGLFIFMSLGAVAAAKYFNVDPSYKITFLAETVALMCFGTSWLIKGKTLLDDQ